MNVDIEEAVRTEEARADRIRRDFTRSVPKPNPDEPIVRKLLGIEGLSNWEAEFAHSVGDQVIIQDRRLTQKQREIVSRILAENAPK